MFKSAYLNEVYATVEKRNAGEPEFLQAVREVLESLEPVVEKRPELQAKGINNFISVKSNVLETLRGYLAQMGI